MAIEDVNEILRHLKLTFVELEDGEEDEEEVRFCGAFCLSSLVDSLSDPDPKSAAHNRGKSPGREAVGASWRAADGGAAVGGGRCLTMGSSVRGRSSVDAAAGLEPWISSIICTAIVSISPRRTLS